MSHGALQQALVIALHDEGFVAAMHAEPEATLAPLGLDARERAQLLAVDRRAFRTDPLRRRRLLRVLAEELKVSTTLVLWETRSAASVEAFFGSRAFRGAVVERRSLAPAFGDFLASLPSRTPQLADVVRLETTTARCRRDRHREPRAGVALAPGVAIGVFDAATVDTMQRVERWIFELGLMPQLALCADGPQLPALPPVGAGVAHLLFAPTQIGVSLTPIDEDLHAVLSAFATPRVDPAAALPWLAPARARALVDSLIEDGLLARG
jgi:hypothetical protein